MVQREGVIISDVAFLTNGVTKVSKAIFLLLDL